MSSGLNIMIEMIQSSFKLILKNEFGLNIMIENDSVFIQTHSKGMSSGWTSW